MSLIEGPGPELYVALTAFSSDDVGRLRHLTQYRDQFLDAIADDTVRARVILKRFPTPDANDRTAVQLMLSSRITVINYFDTPLIEALALNVPTIAFWDPALYELREETHAILEEMTRVGIIHSDPVVAARKLGRVYPQAELWWSDPDIQRVRLRFLDHYGQSLDWASRWTSYLRDFGNSSS